MNVWEQDLLIKNEFSQFSPTLLLAKGNFVFANTDSPLSLVSKEVSVFVSLIQAFIIM